MLYGKINLKIKLNIYYDNKGIVEFIIKNMYIEV